MYTNNYFLISFLSSKNFGSGKLIIIPCIVSMFMKVIKIFSLTRVKPSFTKTYFSYLTGTNL